MIEEVAPTRPIGWWLKEADAQLNAAFDNALHGTGVDRRGWQVLTSLSRGPVRRAALVESLASFDTPTVVAEAVDALRSRGWVEESAELVLLTDAGARQHEVLAPRVDGVRQQVAAALSQDEYGTLIRLLAQLVAALRQPT